MEYVTIDHRPQLQELADHIRTTKRVIVLRDGNGEEIATITPARRVRSRLPKGGRLTDHDALLNLVGIGHSGGSNIAADKDDYLALARMSDQQ